MTAVRVLTYIATDQGYVRRVPKSGGSTTPPIQPGVSDAGALSLGQASYDVPAGAVFVSTSGSDVAAGTKAAPLATLAKAIAKVSAGGTIVMRAGTYFEGEDTQDKAYPMGVQVGKSVTIQNYPGEQVWLDGSQPVTGTWTQEGSYWWAPYDRLFNRSPTSSDGAADGWGSDTGAGGTWVDPSHPQACWPDMLFWDGDQLDQAAAKTDLASGKFWIQGATTSGMWFQGSRVYVADDPSGHEVRYAAKVKLATFAGKTGFSSAIKGVGIRRYASYNAGFGTLYVQHAFTMENVRVEDIAAGFINLDQSTSNTWTKCTFRRIGFGVAQTNKSDNIVIDRVDIQGCNNAGFNVNGPSIAALKFCKGQGLTCKRSIISNNGCNGFWTDQTVRDPHVINCALENNQRWTVCFETASGAILANCRLSNSGHSSVIVPDSDQCRIWNCTITGPAGGVLVFGASQSSRRYDVSTYSYCYDSRLGAAYYTDHPDHQWTVNHVEFCNLVVAEPAATPYALLSLTNNTDATRNPARTWRDMTPKIDGNVYHWNGKQPTYPFVLGNGYQKNPSVYFSMAAYVAATGLDQHSTFSTDDPLGSDGQVTDASLHDNALPLPDDIADLIGQPAGARHVGAFW